VNRTVDVIYLFATLVMPTVLFAVIEQLCVAFLDLVESTIDLLAVVVHCNVVIKLVQQLRSEMNSFGEDFPPVWK